jgi:hypothetical protein
MDDNSQSAFLKAEWRYLAILNFDVDPAVLSPLVPAGTELDSWEGRTVVSLVGFLFLKTRIFGIPVPFHRNFEEVNLRFYVRRKTSDGWRRAVVFVKELVPRFAIALTARALYGENYVAVPMSHRIGLANENGEAVRRVSYRWKASGRENSIQLMAQGESREIKPGSEEEFITEHYWGYTKRKQGRTLEYQVAHPRWRTWTAKNAEFSGEIEHLYGSQFVESLRVLPTSAFLADGSEVTVFKGISLPL